MWTLCIIVRISVLPIRSTFPRISSHVLPCHKTRRQCPRGISPSQVIVWRYQPKYTWSKREVRNLLSLHHLRKLVATWTRTSRISIAWTPKHSIARSPMARSPRARSWLVWRFGPPVESVCAGPIWGPRRLPMERSDMVTPQMFFESFAYRHCNSSHAHVSQFCRVQYAHASALFNPACTRGSSHFALVMFGVVCPIAHPKHLFIFDVSSQISRSPSWVFHLVFLYTITATSDNMLYETGEGIADWIQVPREADLWVNIWEDPFWRHHV